MIAGIVTYTPYVRYWLPAYPLLVASCVLAAGSLFRSIRWRPRGRWPPVARRNRPGVAAVPAGAGSVHQRAVGRLRQTNLRRRVSGAIVSRVSGGATTQRDSAPDDGVLCTGYNGVYLVGGRPYEFAFWWNNIHRIHDRDSFADFCRRYGIRYWMVNHLSADAARTRRPAARTSWPNTGPTRGLVTASGTVAVYDVARGAPRSLDDRRATRVADRARESGEAVDAAPTRPSIGSICRKNAATSRPRSDRRERRSWIGHRIEPAVPGGICRVSLDFWSNEPTDPLFDITLVRRERQAPQPRQRRQPRQIRLRSVALRHRAAGSQERLGLFAGMEAEADPI